jgi:hypothetical protein
VSFFVAVRASYGDGHGLAAAARETRISPRCSSISISAAPRPRRIERAGVADRHDFHDAAFTRGRHSRDRRADAADREVEFSLPSGSVKRRLRLRKIRRPHPVRNGRAASTATAHPRNNRAPFSGVQAVVVFHFVTSITAMSIAVRLAPFHAHRVRARFSASGRQRARFSGPRTAKRYMRRSFNGSNACSFVAVHPARRGSSATDAALRR